jgi:indole-3-glycerol phosphate synthase
MAILQEILSKKNHKLQNSKRLFPIKELRSRIADTETPRNFRSAITRSQNDHMRIIAEIKKASPSSGLIRKDFHHISIAKIYEEKKVNAISVITEEDFFKGSLRFLNEIKVVTSRPILRKDFIFDEYQIYESRANMADAILLIAAILDKNQALEYLHLANELGMSVLFEVHTRKEIDMAIFIKSDIIGINNRNLSTMQVDMDTTLKLKKEIPSDKITVSESGIKTREEVKTLESAGIDAMLIGTSLLEAENIREKIDILLGRK